MSELRIGQLVACREAACAGWLLGIFDGERDGRLYVRLPLSLTCAGKRPEWYSQVVPAERIWPGLSFGREHDNFKGSCAEIKGWRETAYLLQRRVEWLCEQLQAIGDRNGVQECPPPPGGDCRIGSCAECWREASRKAVKEDGDAQRQTARMGR